jgi:hypothetical protein
MEQIWDPLRKKMVTATPEERVRQWFILQLRDTFGVPEHMMRSEVGFRYGKKPWRADVVVFDRAGAPLLVVECKRPDVALDEKVLRQAMRYNSVLDVRFLVVTNGNLTYLYRLEGETFVPCERIPAYEEMLLCQR